MVFKYYKNDLYLTVEVIRKQNKHSYFRVRDGKVLVTANKTITKEEIEKIIKTNFDNFYKTAALQQKTKSNNHIIIFGNKYNLILQKSTKFSYYIENDNLVINLKDENKLDKKLIHIKKDLLNEKILYLNKLIEPNLLKINLKIVPHKIKNVKSYFGKCFFTRNEIYYSLKMAELVDDLILYIMYHEYSHFIVPNHSKDFYKVLEKLMPNYKIAKKRLKLTHLSS